MSSDQEPAAGTVLTDEEPLPQPAEGELPPALWPTPDEEPDIPEGVDIPSPGWCSAQGRINGIPIWSGPNTSSTVLGHLNRGERLNAKWKAVEGARAEGCGGSSSWWIPVAWKGVWAYVPRLCVDHRQP